MSFPRPILFNLVLLALSSPMVAQCPIGTVKVRGRVDNLPADAASAEVSVRLETPKEVKSKASPISNGQFSIEIPFGTESAPWFPLWGHRCNTVPKSIDVKATLADRTVGQVKLVFGNDFETESPNVYRLKRELTIKASNDGG